MIRWKPALNAFDMTFEGRLAAGRKVDLPNLSYTDLLTDPILKFDPLAL